MRSECPSYARLCEAVHKIDQHIGHQPEALHRNPLADAPGEHVKPRIVRYEGGELKLNNTVSLTEALCPGISQFIGKEVIVTDGTTLLGADDKAGVAEIMAAVEQLISSGAAHGELRVIFTTDEEIGNGVDGLDVESLGCDIG